VVLVVAGMSTNEDLVRCNMCEVNVSTSAVQQHLEGRNHSLRKRVAEFNEMNLNLSRTNPDDTSTIKSWIKNLYYHDYLSNKI
jgi:hypothetical protein